MASDHETCRAFLAENWSGENQTNRTGGAAMHCHWWDLSYSDLLRTVEIPKLERRLCLKVIQVGKIKNGYGFCYFTPDVIKHYIPYT